MSIIRVYINPFDTLGNYTEYQEITEHVDTSSLSSIKRSIDSTEYDVGVIKINSISIKLANETGLFSDVENLRSIFKYKRSDSLIKIVWDINDFVLDCGAWEAGEGFLIEDGGVTIFEGILNDEGTVQNIKDQKISFKCFGLEYLLSRSIVPYSSIANGDTMEELILALVDQPPFNDLVTISASNIAVGNNVAIDDITDLENAIVWDSLSDILLTANAVLYIEDNVLYVSERTESAELKYTFYGQASNNGIENIENITNYRAGLHRVFNHWTWSDTGLVSLDTSSVDLFGARSKELDISLITDTTKRNTILEGLRLEFSPRKQELSITCKIDSERLGLFILDQVDVDYPAIIYPSEGEIIPIYGVAVWGVFRYPLDEAAFTLSTTTKFKIIAIDYNLKRERLIYKLREV